MYGILLSSIIDYIKEVYDERLLSKIPYITGATIIDDKIYPDEIMDIIFKETNDRKFYEHIGGHMAKYLLRSTYGSVFLTHWNEYRGFLHGLDKFQEYLKVYYPNVRTPLFTCEEETERGMKLVCRSKESRLINFAVGLIQEVGLSFYRKDFRMLVIETCQDENIRKTTLEFTFTNRNSLRNYDPIDKYNFPLDPTLLGYIFPYSFVISSCMKIVSLGVSLLPVFRDATGQHLSDVIFLRRPQIPLTFTYVLKHTSNMFDLLLRCRPLPTIPQATNRSYVSTSLYSVSSPDGIYYLRLKGSMQFLEVWNMFMFIGTPVLCTLSSLTSAGLNISHLTIHDFSRDLMLAEAQQTVELKMTYDQGQEKQKKLEFFLSKLDEEMKRTEAILHEMVPDKSVFRYDGGSSLKLLENISVLISDIVKFTTVCSFLKPMEVVTALNTMYSKFDLLTAKHGVYKVETIGDAYMVVSSISGNNSPQKICDVALDMKEAIKDVLDPKTGAHLKIRIGIHTGPVVAGIVGLKVPKFCLFGSTVKTAVQLEAASEPMKIKISQSTRCSLSTAYKTAESEFVIINGAYLPTYWLISKD